MIDKVLLFYQYSRILKQKSDRINISLDNIWIKKLSAIQILSVNLAYHLKISRKWNSFQTHTLIFAQKWYLWLLFLIYDDDDDAVCTITTKLLNILPSEISSLFTTIIMFSAVKEKVSERDLFERENLKFLVLLFFVLWLFVLCNEEK